MTVGHIPRELSHIFFVLKGGKVSGLNSSLAHQTSPNLSGGLEIPILMTFEHEDVEIVARMKSLLECYSYEEYAQKESESDEDDVFTLSLIHISEPTRPY